MASSANQTFLPWVQSGVAAAIPAQLAERLAADQPAAVALRIVLTVNGEPLAKDARLYGPGDVVGVDPQQVVRMEPPPGTADFEPNYFPAIEFDRPDLPWLFTPARADEQGRLRPWLCLVVVRRQAGVAIRRADGQAAPVLSIGAPAAPGRELPDLAESHLWAHVQITGAAKADLRRAIEGEPARTVARLLCPRRLEASTEYLACVVPAFEVGRRAGLGLPVGPGETLAPAWGSGARAPQAVELPVYHSWEFRTGAGGDFEALVSLLEPRPLPAGVGKRQIALDRPGFAVDPPLEPGAPGAILGLEGALRPLDSAPDEWPAAARAPFQRALAQILNAPWELATGQSESADPILGPPIYGAWHAAAHLLGRADAPAPAWLEELNLDPRQRAVAALGARVVQAQQEELMAAAWEQLGDVERINQRLRQAQLSRAVNQRYLVKTFERLAPERFVQIVAPARARLVLEGAAAGQPPGASGMRMAARLAGSFMPPAAVEAPLRKLARPRGAISRVYTKAGAAGASGSLARFNVPPPAPALPGRGAVTIDQVSTAVADAISGAGGFIWNPDPVGHWERPRATLMTMLDRFRLAGIGAGVLPGLLLQTAPAALRAAALAHQQLLSGLFSLAIPRDFRQAVAFAALKDAALAGMAPARAVSRAALIGISAGSPTPRGGDELEPIMDAPDFPQPMYAALRDIAQELLFPGLELVPPNTVQLLKTNPKFVEAFLVGLNAEMGRELLWRGYPTDQRGTPFRQFWDTGGEERPDITPIHGWGGRALGTTAVGAGEDKLVLLIRGELLRRYPGTVIYAARAERRDGRRAPAAGGEAYPIFRGSLRPDVTFLGFALTRAEALAGEGWFFILEQQPTEPRFGLDNPPAGGAPPELRTWDDLSWAHLAADAAALGELSHVAVGAVQLAPTQPARGTWGRNAAHMAFITRQKPSRVAIHAAELIP